MMFNNSWYHAKTNVNNCFIINAFFKQSAEEDTSLWVYKSLKTLHRQEAWKLGRHVYDKSNINCRYQVILSTSHTKLYINWMLSTNQTCFSKSNV